MSTFDFKPLTIEKAREMLIYAIERHRELERDAASLTAKIAVNQITMNIVFEAFEAAANAIDAGTQSDGEA